MAELKGKNIILSFDNDDAGKLGFEKAIRMLKNRNCETPYTVSPPQGYKDWNDFRQQITKSDLQKYVSENVKKVDFNYKVISKLM